MHIYIYIHINVYIFQCVLHLMITSITYKVDKQIIHYAKCNGIFLLSLAFYTTHKLQPLERGAFLLLKSYFNKGFQKRMQNHLGRKI